MYLCAVNADKNCYQLFEQIQELRQNNAITTVIDINQDMHCGNLILLGKDSYKKNIDITINGNGHTLYFDYRRGMPAQIVGLKLKNMNLNISYLSSGIWNNNPEVGESCNLAAPYPYFMYNSDMDSDVNVTSSVPSGHLSSGSFSNW